MPEAFQVFDPSGSGHVDMKELRHIVSHLVLHVFHALFPLAASEDARGNYWSLWGDQAKRRRLDYA